MSGLMYVYCRPGIPFCTRDTTEPPREDDATELSGTEATPSPPAMLKLDEVNEDVVLADGETK